MARGQGRPGLGHVRWEGGCRSRAIGHDRAEGEPRGAGRAADSAAATGEALSDVQGSADAVATSLFPAGLPVGMEAADTVAMAPQIQAHAVYRRALNELGYALVGIPDALPTCDQIAREQRHAAGTKQLLPAATNEVTAALKAAWAGLARLEQ